MSDFPPRVEKLRETIRFALPEADFLIEEIWKHVGPKTDGFGRSATPELSRFWRVSIQTGPEELPTVIDVPDKVLLQAGTQSLVLGDPFRKIILRNRR